MTQTDVPEVEHVAPDEAAARVDALRRSLPIHAAAALLFGAVALRAIWAGGDLGVLCFAPAAFTVVGGVQLLLRDRAAAHRSQPGVPTPPEWVRAAVPAACVSVALGLVLLWRPGLPAVVVALFAAVAAGGVGSVFRELGLPGWRERNAR